MMFVKSLLITILGLGAMTFAAPVDANVDTVADGCSGASRYTACERGRDEKKAGYREEHRGEREIERGQNHRGEHDLREGQHEVAQGQHRECKAGGRC